MIEVIDPGPLSSVQEPFGRAGLRHLGIPAGGAVDPWSARLANRLVGNAEGAALLELTLSGASLWFAGPTTVSLTGGMTASVGGVSVPSDRGWRLRAGSLLRISAGDGARGYLAAAGGIEVEPVLGSASTDLRSGFGGLDGRALRPGDRLALGMPSGAAARWTGSPGTGPIRIVDGPHGHAAELAGDWIVGPEIDRAGARLEGGKPAYAGEVPSMGLPLGAVQVPPDGRPIVMLADRPVTGGYPVPACVIRADVGRVAQLRTGDRLTFVSVSMEEARAALRRVTAELAALEPIETARDDELGWAGSHE